MPQLLFLGVLAAAAYALTRKKPADERPVRAKESSVRLRPQQERDEYGGVPLGI